MTSFKTPYTENGFDLFQVSSAMQKAVRRGNEREAMYWATELAVSNYSEYFWKRIKIIASEDIGFANPMLPVLLDTLYNTFKIHDKKQRGDGFLFITHALIACVRSPKSRMLDWAKCVYYEAHDKQQYGIPDYALDQHTRTGKSKGRGMVHFMEEGSKLHPMGDVAMETDYREEAYYILCTKYDVGKDVTKDPNKYPGYQDYLERVKPEYEKRYEEKMSEEFGTKQLTLFPEMPLNHVENEREV